MKIAVLNNCVPFVRGGAEYLGNALVEKLREYGHQALLVRVPFRWNPPDAIVEGILACRLMKVPNVDRVIALKFPVYHVPHPDKVLWLLHQFRQAYDLWGTPWQELPDTPAGERIRAVVTSSDNEALPAIARRYTNSEVTSRRLRHFNHLESQVLYPPLLSAGHFSTGECGDYIFYPSRITDSKRQHLLVASMKYVQSPVRLVIAGKEENPADLERIREIIRRDGLGNRVQVRAEFISEAEKAALFRDALACAYIPYDEDSYGYVTLESYECRKAVLTCNDSGGTDVVVKHGITGLVVEPTPRALADAMDRLYFDKDAARRMGEAGLELVHTLKISWDHVIESLTS